MTFTRLAGIAIALYLFTVPAFGQAVIVVHDPTLPFVDAPALSDDDAALMEKSVLPKVRKKLVSEGCSDSYELTGFVEGSFSRAHAKQTLAFYQFCETGNGLGNVGIALLEDGKVVGSYVAESGWAYSITRLPDVNQNGLDEFTLAYSGGMHQGEGGIGVDIVEFTKNGPRGLGWFHAEAITDTESDWGYKVTVKKGKTPVFYRQKYRSTEGSSWMKIGKNTRFALKNTPDQYTAVK
jgi:hypothetical protein